MSEFTDIFTNGISTVSTSNLNASGSLVFFPAGISQSEFSEDFENLANASGSVLMGTFNNDLEIKNPKDSLTFLYLSSSGNSARLGVGTNDPKSTFDFKSTEDTTTGTELVLRSARSNLGAVVGDEGGSINFTIDSGSFINLKNSGSLGKIKANVVQVGVGGVEGSIAFALSKGAGPEQHDIFEIGYTAGNSSGFNTIFSSSIEMVDFNSAQESTFTMRDDTGNIRFSINDGLLYASGNISSSGDIIGTINGGTF
jgi:hypothetical protein